MKQAVITGSTGGIGQEISNILAGKGWNLILVNRAGQSAIEQKEALSKKFPTQKFVNYSANLMEMSEVKSVAEQIESSETHIKALYNVAGILTEKSVLSSEGYESHFAINTLAPYVLIKGLKKSLQTKDKDDELSVIVNFSTGVVNSVKNLDISSLPSPKSIGGLTGAYANSKLALDMVTCFMKEELLKDGILIESVDPGATKTSMTKDNKAMPWIVRLVRPLLFKSPLNRANEIIGAVEKGVKDKKTGLYISEGTTKTMPSAAESPIFQDELKKLLKEITAI